jgi:hypothetical protein
VARDGYRFTSEAIVESGYLQTLKVAIGGLCISMAALGSISLLCILSDRTVPFREPFNPSWPCRRCWSGSGG